MGMNAMIRFGAIVLALALVGGCGKPGASAVAAGHSQLFPDGQLKTDWDTATAAMQTNGYIAAGTALNKMLAENPSAAQLEAIHDTLRALNGQMVAAADKGDVNARNTLEELSKMSQSRRR